jgi:hypothetical protein
MKGFKKFHQKGDCLLLKDLLKLFKLTTKELYKKVKHDYQNLEGIEKLLVPVRNGSESFCQNHINIIQDNDKEFWSYWDKFREDYSEEELRLAAEAINNRGEIKDCIIKLFHVFRNIQQVSIILRFIDPVNYGMFTPPVEKILETKRSPSPIQTYINYLNDLRKIQSECPNIFDRIADIEMALWVLSNLEKRERSGIFGDYVEKYADEYYYRMREYLLRPNSLIKTIKYINLPDDVWEEDLIEKAKMLKYKDLFLAAKVAGDILKNKIPGISRKLGIATEDTNGRWISRLVLLDKISYPPYKIITKEERINLKEAWKLRNKVCKDEKAEPETVDKLINAAEFILLKFMNLEETVSSSRSIHD